MKSCEKKQLQNSLFFLDCQFLPHPFSKQILLIINLPQCIPSSIFFQLGIPKFSAATTRSDQIKFVHLGSNVKVGCKLDLCFEGRPILNSQKQSKRILQFCFVGVTVSFFFFFFTSLHDYCMRIEKNMMGDLQSPRMWCCHLISSHRGGAWAICFFCYCSYNSQ